MKPRSFTTDRGSVILVGRCDSQNDEITSKASCDPNAYWFHVAGGVPGAHVVLHPVDGEMHKDEFDRAAGLALAYSKSPNRLRGDVVFCKAANVKKLKGSAPGSVVATSHFTMKVVIN